MTWKAIGWKQDGAKKWNYVKEQREFSSQEEKKNGKKAGVTWQALKIKQKKRKCRGKQGYQNKIEEWIKI